VKGISGLWIFWLLSRGVMLLLVVKPHLIYSGLAPVGDVGHYRHWGNEIWHGSFPSTHDKLWQYPPLAGVVMVAPRLVPGLSYLHAFMLLAAIMDAVILTLFIRRGDRMTGAWTWNVGLILLGATAFLRYDLFVTCTAVLAILWLPKERVFGVFAAVGAMLKVWPVLLLLGMPRDRRLVNSAIAFVVTAVVVLAGGLTLKHQLSFVTNQSNRGMEIEALAVTPWQIARLVGVKVSRPVYRYGAYQFTGSTMNLIGMLCLLATVAGFVLIAYMSWRRRPQGWTPALCADVGLTATMVFVAISRVLSPQYMIWLVGMSAACMAFKGSRQGLTVALILAATAVSQVLYPFNFDQLVRGDTFPILLVVVRNILLMAATVTSIVAIWPRRSVEASAEPEPTLSPANG
jgi:hypothetical protein